MLLADIMGGGQKERGKNKEEKRLWVLLKHKREVQRQKLPWKEFTRGCKNAI